MSAENKDYMDFLNEDFDGNEGKNEGREIDENFVSNPERIDEIWETIVKPVIDELLSKKCFPLIQDHFEKNMEKIENLYKKRLSITHTHTESMTITKNQILVPFGCRVLEEGEKPEIYVILDHVDAMLSHITKEAKGDKLKEQSTRYLVILTALMHELDHLALGKAIAGVSSEQLIEQEISTWARTVQNVLTPLQEVYNLQLTGADLERYLIWKKNPNEDSPEWRQHITQRYTSHYAT